MYMDPTLRRSLQGSSSRRRYAIAGTGVRGMGFAEALADNYSDVADLVALYDRNMLRMNGFNQLIGRQIPAYTDFDTMVAETDPSHLLVCTPDNTHHQLIEMGFSSGLECITEKPMATDDQKVRHILSLEKRYDRKVTVTFNCRFMPYVAAVKAALMEKPIGDILSVTLDWFLGKEHGAEYFRRWHADMNTSGGLLVHKATHHFDMVNWWLDDLPEEVAAHGALMVYGRNGRFHGERCSNCRYSGGACDFEMQLHKVEEYSDIFDKLYWDVENVDGYIRDRCLFDPGIDIYDTMNVLVRYKRGAQLSYSLTAYSPIEGYRITMTGTEGRLEASDVYSPPRSEGQEAFKSFRILTGHGLDPKQVEERIVRVEVDSTSHGGGDERLYRHLFRSDIEDPLGQMADSYDGAMSCLIGIAANYSIQTKSFIRIADLLDEPVVDHLGRYQETIA